MCGEHTFDDCAFPWYQGSSPHVRGALAMSSKACLVFGIIPACAGSTNSSMVFPVDKRDHPRMCGEHGRVVTVNGNVKGSSPHVRGAPAAVVVCHLVRGIIPACAGSTRRSWSSTACSGDHPRMCGEHSSARMAPSAAGGSSPHVRGARAPRAISKRWVGIIPACAGSTRAMRSVPRFSRDHPRMCGEHFLLLSLFAFAAGSSPHVRGAHVTAMVHHTSAGIIPACAGSTDIDAIKRLVAGDHPRMCGEHHIW